MNVAEAYTRVQLPVMESFLTLQGEGFHAGKAAYFVRLAGCDVGCVWCDVKESWKADDHPLIAIQDIVEALEKSGVKFCVITGGEPAMYDLTALISKLHEKNIYTAIETSGCYPVIGEIDWYCFSPKKFKSPVDEAYERANELKVIINHPSDFEWAEQHASRINPDCKLFLQPEWSKRERFLPAIVEYIKTHPQWRISLQTHKYLNIP